MEEAIELDSRYKTLKEEFSVPTFGSFGIPGDADTKTTYLCGNSLGLMPLAIRRAINDELDAWGERAVDSHFRHPGLDDGKTNWMDIDLPVIPLIKDIVGAQEDEVAIMGSLTANLNALMVAFYKPQGKRTKILFEKGSFPSDYYAIFNQLRLNSLDPQTDMIQMEPRKGEYTLRTQDIISQIESHSETLALVLLPGIQYYTGQLFDIEVITRVAKSHGIIIGWDLAHAVGNVPLKLHDWGVDFAVWCSYKYLNSGPGAISGIFVHSSHGTNEEDKYMPRLAGWWGNNASTRFKMMEFFDPIQGALGFRQSNPSVIDVVSVHASLKLFQEYGGIGKLREKSVALTRYLETLLKDSPYFNNTEYGFKILTPDDPEDRGAQLSLLFFPRTTDSTPGIMDDIHQFMTHRGVICDERRPDVIRIAPVPLYNTFQDVFHAVEVLNSAFDTKSPKSS
ncbi:BNA5 [Cyberlindnera jadinii]|uniref:Kynureninase n=1 Tax=Cyberlindnera jadinii (strain ATCC 18201 / CBS 1600 / BCRC 20928 / JCM 3617 / NBRC 0987 / NRRL Y-1542) TaxID=983966 RepID=A0A0H5C5F8_CYBJN|nr:kynureninase [Cyberlindnera jadinii NRRL Y-1542]ODV74461.1 kynureninase [Cyberlindnera jadinii NRRL Y-1542]CEP23047.1 BNA5 [Cyberlindnera jadinii]